MNNPAAVLYGVRDIRYEDRPVPTPGPREVLVEVRAVGVCGSDVHYYEHGRIGDYVVDKPLVLGHETSGVIVGRGSQATKHRLGQRVALEPGVPCGSCAQCRAGRYNLCPDIRFHGTPPVDGTFQRFVAIREDFAHPIPDGLSDEAGALMEPLTVGVWACRRAGVQAGSRVLVTGAGPVGLLALQVALASGATEVTVSDVSPVRLELARSLGATRVVDAAHGPLMQGDDEVDALIECSGDRNAISDGLRALRPAGVAVMVGMGPGADVMLPMQLIQGRELWLTGVFRYANSFPAAIALAAAGRVRVGDLATHRFRLTQVADALEIGRRDPSAIKAIVQPAGPGS
ncbi:MAG: NAD(P)-dependent alcohol dehydrogenase [Candidatus Limnocylindrales bacterium]